MRVRIRFEPRFALYVEERQWHPSQKLEACRVEGVELTLEVGGLDESRAGALVRQRRRGDGAPGAAPCRELRARKSLQRYKRGRI